MHQCSEFLHIAHSGTLPFSILDDILENFQKEGGLNGFYGNGLIVGGFTGFYGKRVIVGGFNGF